MIDANNNFSLKTDFTSLSSNRMEIRRDGGHRRFGLMELIANAKNKTW